MVNQTARTGKLLELTGALEKAGIPYAVVKGAVCRTLYSKPDLRPSGDEDIFIPATFRLSCGEIFTACGMIAPNLRSEDSVDHWQDPRTGLHVELHTALFSTGWPAEAVLNPYFDQQLAHTVSTPVENGQVHTLEPTAHLLFLIAHALKHFITGGFGVRTWADILTFCERNQAQIDQNTLWPMLEQIHADRFFRQLLLLGRDYMAFDTTPWDCTASDRSDDALLLDMLDAGIYGQTTMDRKHSAALSLQAVKNSSEKAALRTALFPSAQSLSGRYPILTKAPFLLPAAWLLRLGAYGAELLKSKGDNSPAGAIALSKQRSELLTRYGILSKGKKENI